METSAYLATTYWVIGVNLIFLIATYFLLKTGDASTTTQRIFAVGSLLWIVLVHYVCSAKLIFPKELSGGFFYGITLGAAIVVLLGFYFSPLRNIFERISQVDIQIVQGVRVFVASGFLMEGVLDVIPGWFSIMDGYLHVTSGFFALIAAIAVLKEHPWKQSLLWIANGIGLLDIVIIVTSISLVVWEDLGPFHNMQYVVFYTGVLLLWFHFISISKLLKK